MNGITTDSSNGFNISFQELHGTRSFELFDQKHEFVEYDLYVVPGDLPGDVLGDVPGDVLGDVPGDL